MARLGEVLKWFREVQAEGGYRAYYAKPGRGILQGGGPAGGLGMDQEFMESVLVPQVMLYGFLGLTPEPDGFTLAPRLPKDWPSLTVSRVRLHDHEVEITATRRWPREREDTRERHQPRPASRRESPDDT